MKRALVSVSNKTGLVDFVKGLIDEGYEIISTGERRKRWRTRVFRLLVLARSRTFRKSWMVV